MARLLAPLLVLLALVSACGGEGGAAEGEVTVVATTTQAADLARNVAGDDAEVVGLLPPNADPHGYEIRPADMQSLAEADVIVRSGGELDDWLRAAIEGAGADAPVLTLAESVELRGDDPHWWHDPRNALLAVAAIRDALAAAAPARAAAYRANARAYGRDLRALDAGIAACIGDIPAGRRKLVTTHDALGYYADRYGLEVIGAVIPSLSTQGQPSAGETAALVETIRAEGVPAIFAESSVNPKVERAIAREAGARLGAPLYADTLGPEGSPGATYLGSMRANTLAIADGLGAGCTLPEG